MSSFCFFIIHQNIFLFYLSPKMFDWFRLDIEPYEDMFTIDANFLMFKRGFVTSLIMKAWVICALDSSCISPPGSRLYRCCGCHRFRFKIIVLKKLNLKKLNFFFTQIRPGRDHNHKQLLFLVSDERISRL